MSNVSKRQPVLCRLARQARRATPQGFHRRRNRTDLRAGPKGPQQPKRQAGGPTVRESLTRYTQGARPRHTADVADQLTSIAGDLNPRKLTHAHTAHLNRWVAKLASPATRYHRSGACQTVLRFLSKTAGSPKDLDKDITRGSKVRPRNTTATKEERAKLLAAARPHMRCWLLLCSDLAIRSGTAATLTPECYDKAAGMLRFVTKYGATSSLPVTTELSKLLNQCKSPTESFVSQLSGLQSTYGSLSIQFRKLRKAVGITRKLTPHDLRRTTARDVYAITHDLRMVQALLGHSDLAHTMWYLQDDTTSVNRTTLELAKTNPASETVQ